MDSIKAGAWAIARVTGHLINTGRKEQGDALCAACGVHVFTFGEMRSAFVVALCRQDDREVLDSVLTELNGFKASVRVFVADKRKVAA